MIITVGRQFGSGGRQIAEKMAERLGYAYYDNKLLQMAASAGNIDAEIAAQLDEKPVRSLLYSTYVAASSSFGENMPLNQKLAFAQFDKIREIAEKGNAVIVGRCADYILRDRKDTANVFIYAPDAYRHQRAIEVYGVPAELVEKTIKKNDKARADYYNFFTQRKWGFAPNYDLCVDSSVLGPEETGHLLAEFMELFEAKLKK